MKVSIAGQEQEINVVSVVLEKDIQIPVLLKMFHCFNCGKSVIRYSGMVIQIFPGETPSQLPLIAFCKNCKTQYLFNSVV